jgi:hypothetical protein
MRTVKTTSGATAVQVVWSSRRGSREIEHLGSAHDEAELEALKAAAQQRIAAGQPFAAAEVRTSLSQLRLQARAIRHPVGDRGATGMQRGEGGRRHQPYSHADRALVHVEDGLVDVEVLDRPRLPGAEPGQ